VNGNQINVVAEETKVSGARRVIETNRIMKLPQIEIRKKSHELSEYRKI